MQGQTLTASAGAWSNSPTSYSYQWQDCTSAGCSSILGATGSSYTLQASDVGDSIDVVVTAANAGGSSSATSAQTAAVAGAVPPPTAPPVNTGLPTIIGAATQGQTLTASNGTWTNSPTSYSYQWQDCTSSSCTDIGGATSSGYTLQSTDNGDTIDVVVTATNAGGSTNASSAQTATVTSGSTGSSSSVPGNPPSTAANVSVGLPGITSITNCCGSLLTSTPPVTEVWDWNNGSPSSYACPGSQCIYKGEYVPAYEQPDTRYNANTEPLSWFEANHPDWLEFKCAASSLSESTAETSGDLAYISGNSYTIPLDVSNPAVLSWLETSVWGPLLASGNYQHLDFDNFSETQGSWTGAACGHYNSSGTWVQQYSGTINDPSWRTFQTNLAANLQAWLHADYPNVAFAANLSWCDCYLSDELNLLSHVDLWMDEQGFTNGNNGAGGFYGTAWSDKVAAVQAVVSAGHGWQDLNQEPVSFASTTPAEREWALGNYLLMKNDASWIYICGEQEYGTVLIAPEYAAAKVGIATDTYYLNQGVYRRDFTNGLVLVNPSTTSSFTVSVPANTYKDLYGNVQPGSITLAPESAIVLVHV